MESYFLIPKSAALSRPRRPLRPPHGHRPADPPRSRPVSPNRPGIRDRARACLDIVDAQPPFDDLLVDRGYTMAKGSQLAGPLRAGHITVTMDLHMTQRVVRPGPEAGTVWVDGSLYTSALPETHRSLEAPPAGNDCRRESSTA